MTSNDAVQIKVTPRSSRDQVLGEHDGAIAIKLKAPPVDGQANAALIAFIAKKLGISRSLVTLIRGQTCRSKSIEVEGWSAALVRRALLG